MKNTNRYARPLVAGGIGIAAGLHFSTPAGPHAWHTGLRGGGIVFVKPVECVVRIRTGKEGREALKP